MNAVELGIPNTAASAAVNILIVDDLDEKLLVYRSILEDLQQNLVMVRSGKEALRQLLEHEFAVILLDVNMPDIDGLETAAMIRQYKKTAQTPIIFITAYADEIQTVRGYSLGAVDYITTPVIPEILRSKVKVFVDLHRMNRQVLQWAQEREALLRAEAARVAAEEATRRADFLAKASHILTRSLDGESIIKGLLNLVVPTLADIAVLTLLDERGNIRRTDSIAQDAGKIWYGPHDKGVHIEPPPHLAQQIGDALNNSEALSFSAAGLWHVNQSIGDTDTDASTCIAVQHVSTLPLRTGTQVLGMLLVAYGPTRSESAADTALLKEVVSRASIAIENGLLYSAIQQGDQRKNEFLAMLAHELRNPLAPIRNAIHVVQLLEFDDPKLDWAANIIGRQVTHIARIVDDLLDVSRIARGKVVIQKNIIALDTVIKQALETSRPHIDARSHQLHVSAPITPIFIKGDLVRLTQIFSNLLNNAAKYTPGDGQIWFDANCANDMVRISVRDNGEGITPEFLPHIFDLFTQAHQSIDRAQGGLGVGLTLVKQLVELHSGKVEVKSAGRGQGTEFIVYLPEHAAIDINADDAPAQASIAAVPQRKPRILVVDDLTAAADSMRTLFEMQDYRVETAYDGMTALQIAHNFQPNVVLLDIGLPEMDGYEVARRLREIPQINTALLIALTGYGQADDRQRAMDAGFDVHLIKPAEIGALCNLITEHCAKL